MIDLRNGDCLEVLKNIEDNSVDLILTDPPYHLTSITKRFGKKGSAPASTKNNDGSFSRLSKGFMGKEWDGLDENGVGIAFNVEVWKEAYRVLKPGSYLMAFSGSRTYHRMAVAIEDAGFEIKDMIEWVYGSGFPKALDISKALDKKLGVEREIVGSKIKKAGDMRSGSYGKGGNYADISIDITKPSSDIAKQYEGYKTQLKPAHEPICLAMKPLSEKNFAENVMKWGTGGLNIDGTRIGYEDTPNPATNPLYRAQNGYKIPEKGQESKGAVKFTSSKNEINSEGRYPANFIISEDVAPVLDKQSGYSKSSDAIRRNNQSKHTGSKNGAYCYGKFNDCDTRGYSDAGGASRFFYNAKIEEEDYIPFYYTAKCSKKERNSDIEGQVHNGLNNHATVKPKSILTYLLKLGLPPQDSVVLDLFAGSGSLGLAIADINKETGRNHKAILIEKDEEHCEIIKKRCCL